MKNEIATAVVFITSMVKNKGKLSKEQINTFSDKLTVALAGKYRNHWYEESPSRGQAYRCLRISPTVPEEPLIRRVANNSNIAYCQLCLPKDMVLWVDPGEVACRFGDRGSIFLVSSFRKPTATDNTMKPTATDNNTINSVLSNDQTQLRRPGGSAYRYTTYSKQPINTLYQVNQNRYQNQYWNQTQNQSQEQEWEQDINQAQDRYHWSNIYSTRTVTVA